VNRNNLANGVRERLKRLPPPYEAHYGVIPLPPPEDGIPVGQVLARLSAADVALAKIETLAAELKDPYLISRILPRREAVSSSSIEGTNSTLDELLSSEENDEREKSDAAVQVRDYALALDDFLPRARMERHALFTVQFVQDLHRAVMKSDTDYKDVPGELRKIVVWIGGAGHIANSIYNPTPPDDIPACLAETMTYMRCEGMQAMVQSLIVRMSVAHSHFEAVHPFRDGNGRVGRLLLPLMMAAEGLTPVYLSPYIEAHKQAYYDSLKAAQQRLEWQELIGFVSDAIVGTVDELLTTRDALRRLGAIWRNRRKFRKDSGAERALDVLPHYPVLTIRRLSRLLDISTPAATTAVEQLIEAGILVERTGYARNRVFMAIDALTVVDRPFGQEAVLPER
jgi:Fic family protein